MRPQNSWPVFLLVSAQLIRPSHSLLDSGTASAVKLAKIGLDSSAQQDGGARISSPPLPPADTLVVSDARQIDLRPGCKRSTDFFDQVCSIPSKGTDDAASQSSSGSLVPRVTADLLVCDFPEVEPLIRPGSASKTGEKRPSATYAVSGTIVVQGADAEADTKFEASRIPELGATPSTSDGHDTSHEVASPPSATRLDASYPGPDDEGFWRQRDGQHEWHPASGHTVKEESDDTGNQDADSQTAQQSGQAESLTSAQPDASGLSEYNAWSAEQEQGAFLSFEEWKERHVQIDPGQARGSNTNPKSAQHQTAQVSPAPSDSSTPAKQAEGYTPPLELIVDPPSQEDASAEVTHLDGIDASSSGFASVASASGRTGTLQTSERSGTHVPQPPTERPSSSRSDPSGDLQMTSSVVAGDTGSQLSKLKHRWNFASLDCAAVVHRTNPEAKFASSILSEKKDRYMLSPCPRPGGRNKGGSQFVVVELCEEIKIDTIVLANYEFFSNMFKKFTVTAARQLTGRESDWTQLGVFRARNIRGQQLFRIPSAPRSEAFFRYVRIDFQEHFGSEFYCPVSLLRVYGITEMEEYKREFEGHDRDTDPIPETTEADLKGAVDIAPPLPSPIDATPIDVPLLGYPRLDQDLADLTTQDEDIWRKHEQAFQRKLQNQSLTYQVSEAEAQDNFAPSHDNLSSNASPSPSEQHAKQAIPSRQTSSHDTAVGVDRRAQCAPEENPDAQIQASDVCTQPREKSEPFYYVEVVSRPEAKPTLDGAGNGSAAKPSSGALPINARSLPEVRLAADLEAGRGRRPNVQRPSASSSGQPGNPGSESVYRAIHRRLNALESNATLSHSYIEHSGKMLREVFGRMETRQETRMSDMLRLLNASNWQQIEALKRRQHVDLQRAIFEFDVHRQQADNERRALLREVQILAEEVLLEKRLSIAQLVMLLAVFVFVGLTRGSRTVPLLHAGLTRIGRSSKRSEVRADSKVLFPASLNMANARFDLPIDAAQASTLPNSRSTLRHAHQDQNLEHQTGVTTLAQRSRDYLERGYLAETPQALSLGSGSSNVPASPNAAMHSVQREDSKLVRKRLAALAGPRGENVIDMLSHPRAGSRLILLLETLDALNRSADLRRLPRYSTQHKVTVRRHKAADRACASHPDKITEQAPSSNSARHVPRSHRSSLAVKDDRTPSGHRRHGAPGRNTKLVAAGLDDLAGMSSDWTERSENDDASENVPYLSEEEAKAIRAAQSDQFSLEPDEAPYTNGDLGRINGVNPQPIELMSNATVPSASGNFMPTSIQTSVRDAQAVEHVAERAASDLPSIAKADGHLSSSDSESEGGAWHRVLPRRIGHTNSIRKGRHAMLDGKSHKLDSEAKFGTSPEASDRRGSPRPSSSHGNPFKSGKPALNRFFRGSTPDHASLEASRNRRSGTPDTVRDVKFV